MIEHFCNIYKPITRIGNLIKDLGLTIYIRKSPLAHATNVILFHYYSAGEQVGHYLYKCPFNFVIQKIDTRSVSDGAGGDDSTSDDGITDDGNGASDSMQDDDSDNEDSPPSTIHACMDEELRDTPSR